MTKLAPAKTGLVKTGPAMWAGFECSSVRIGDGWRHQLLETGHLARCRQDLEAVAGLGVRVLRVPVLWEMAVPRLGDAPDWSAADRMLGEVRRLGLTPIVGFVHHGSGSLGTSLLDPEFPSHLAKFAASVAQRYPWVTGFTPLNEPLTTARFSCLYGHWFPHERNERAFLRALFIECAAIQAAMAAIRGVTSDATLVQTEDLGRVFAARRLCYQAAHENERRWLSFDLLFGRVGVRHRWYRRFIASGVAARDLDRLAAEALPPDLVGLNHYLTSDRYLDGEVEGYPADAIGGNGRHRYADVAAVRAHVPPQRLGPLARLMEAAERYNAPLALTEVHNGSTEDEQVRWLCGAWRAALAAKAKGADVRAITAWSVAGAYDWPSLLLRRDGAYEAGLFDIRHDPPRPTLAALAVAEFAAGRAYAHPCLAHPGWWHRADRHHKPRLALRPRSAARANAAAF